MAAAFASAGDLAAFLGIDVPASGSKDLARMNLILQLASDWARDLARRAWAAPGDAPATVKGIVLASARREWDNPKRVGYETKGPESAAYIQAAYPAGFFTDAEERWFRKFHTSGGLFTISTSRDSEEESEGYLRIAGDGGYFPMWSPLDPGWEASLRL